jgi:hypothetical protein
MQRGISVLSLALALASPLALVASAQDKGQPPEVPRQVEQQQEAPTSQEVPNPEPPATVKLLSEAERKVKIKEFLAKFFPGHDVGDDEDLFALGFGNSLFAMQLVQFIETSQLPGQCRKRRPGPG